jgi:RNA polymerase sigma factor (sigma-70 family)
MGGTKVEDFHGEGRMPVSDDPGVTGAPYEEMRRMAKRLAFRGLGDWDEAEDVAQEVLIAAHEALQKDPNALNLAKSLARWVFAVAGNKIVDRLRSLEASEQPFYEYEAWKERQTAAEWDVEGQASADELEAIINRVLLEMPAAQCETWLLVYVEGLKYAQAAKRRGVSINTHKKNLKLAQAAIDEAIEAHEREGQ